MKLYKDIFHWYFLISIKVLNHIKLKNNKRYQIYIPHLTYEQPIRGPTIHNSASYFPVGN
jgi:hypothetical protein